MSTRSDIVISTNGGGKKEFISRTTADPEHPKTVRPGSEFNVGDYEPSILSAVAETDDMVSIFKKGDKICYTKWGCYKNGDDSDNAFGTDQASTVTALNAYFSA